MSDAYLELDRVLDQESWDYLNDNYPLLAASIQSSVRQGKSPSDIKRRVVERLGAHREALAKRCEVAARYLTTTVESR